MANADDLDGASIIMAGIIFQLERLAGDSFGQLYKTRERTDLGPLSYYYFRNTFLLRKVCELARLLQDRRIKNNV